MVQSKSEEDDSEDLKDNIDAICSSEDPKGNKYIASKTLQYLPYNTDAISDSTMVNDKQYLLLHLAFQTIRHIVIPTLENPIFALKQGHGALEPGAFRSPRRRQVAEESVIIHHVLPPHIINLTVT